MNSFADELRWRGMLNDAMPGTEDLLNAGPLKGYIGFDPSADSLGIGNMVQVMTLCHFQRCGHTPIALVGGATGMVGDPSGKSAERNLLDLDQLEHNLRGIKKQLEKFLDFEGPNGAQIVNNYDWFKEFDFLRFIREVGKHITVNYMLAKDSVKNRIDTGMSFTEFSYQLIQGYDFYHLWKNHGCALQMGGSDQWGNITTGTELIRRMAGGEAFALTTNLIKKADGSKFGKTEGGNIWLDPKRTSPYKFYQFLLNAADADAATYTRVFSLRQRAEIEDLEAQQLREPHLRPLQHALANELCARVHSAGELAKAQHASQVLFGKSATDELLRLDSATLLDAFEGVPQATMSKSVIDSGINALTLLHQSGFLPSQSEARRAIKEGSIAVNREKVTDEATLFGTNHLIAGAHLLLQRGKKNYFLLTVA